MASKDFRFQPSHILSRDLQLNLAIEKNVGSSCKFWEKYKAFRRRLLKSRGRLLKTLTFVGIHESLESLFRTFLNYTPLKRDF